MVMVLTLKLKYMFNRLYKFIQDNTTQFVSSFIYTFSDLVIGQNNSGDVLVTSIEAIEVNDQMQVRISILYDCIDCPLYGKDYSFSSITIDEFGVITQSGTIKSQLTFVDNLLEIVTNYFFECPNEWIEGQKEIQKNRNFFQNNNQYHYYHSKSNPSKRDIEMGQYYVELTEEQEIEALRLDGVKNWLMFRRPLEYNSGYKKYLKAEFGEGIIVEDAISQAEFLLMLENLM